MLSAKALKISMFYTLSLTFSHTHTQTIVLLWLFNPLCMGIKIGLLFTGGGGTFTLPTFFIISQAKTVQF